jgi:hypothetical protein
MILYNITKANISGENKFSKMIKKNLVSLIIPSTTGS